jgi:hypothetical protein
LFALSYALNDARLAPGVVARVKDERLIVHLDRALGIP